MSNQYNHFRLKEVSAPKYDNSGVPVFLSDETMSERKNRILQLMKENQLDTLVIYADVEHGGNFEYLTGFVPRFEEALLILHQNEEAYLILGNENLNKAKYSRIPAKPIHAPYFSLPNQPMENTASFQELLVTAGIKKNSRVGIIGWKYFTSKLEDNRRLFDIPYFILSCILRIVGHDANVQNRTGLFIGPEYGARTVNNANEIAHYEFGSSLASDCVLKAMDELEPGITEMRLGSFLNAYGQPNSVVTIAAAGERFEKANLYPTDKKVQVGDKISLTAGYKGGLSSRAGYAVSDKSQLPKGRGDYIEVLAAPYFLSIAAWLENISVGMMGGDMYTLMDHILPKEEYHWSLCPGHLTGDEEWMSSPIYAGSREILKSGMLLQVDIIPSKAGYAGAGAENGVALANDKLKNQIRNHYPELYQRFMLRRQYMESVLGIRLSPDILPLSSTVGYYRPFLLNKKLAFVQKV